ncbi:MAG: hypothetical protein AB8I08_03715 [Sandaracinaceae bacterium]
MAHLRRCPTEPRRWTRALPSPTEPPLDAGAGSCELSPSPSPRCCYEDADCPGTPDGMPEQCAGGSCETGGQGICVPRAMGGTRCFTGASFGCSECTETCGMPTSGTCSTS